MPIATLVYLIHDQYGQALANKNTNDTMACNKINENCSQKTCF